jgi:hypothetical protein
MDVSHDSFWSALGVGGLALAVYVVAALLALAWAKWNGDA